MNHTKDVPAVRHRLIIVCLIRRNARTAGAYRPLDEMHTDCPCTWPNKLREPKVLASLTITSSLHSLAIVMLAATYYLKVWL